MSVLTIDLSVFLLAYMIFNWIITLMLICCYQSRADDHTLDLLFQFAVRVGGWSGHLSTHLGMGIQVWIPESYVSLVPLIDPEVLRRPNLDYII